jgi:hypothetical protein
VIVIGAVAERHFEARDGTVKSFEDSLRWAVVTATTVGCGDIASRTTEGARWPWC